MSAKATAPDGTDVGLFSPGDSLKEETSGADDLGGGGSGDAHVGGAALVVVNPSASVRDAVECMEKGEYGS